MVVCNSMINREVFSRTEPMNFPMMWLLLIR